jgi:DNA-binding transcriptional regulator WhiA
MSATKIQNENAFETIDNHNAAYWLGFLMADGSVSKSRNRISIRLAEKDRHHLESLHKFLKYNKKVYRINNKIKNGIYVCCSTNIDSGKIKQDLINLGCVPNKTKIIRFPEIDSEFHFSFLRGYFDGDGYIGRNSVNKQLRIEFVGTESMMTSIQKLLQVKPQPKYKKSKDIYRLVICGNKQCMRIADQLYQDGDFYLERKKRVFYNAVT